MSAHKPRKRFGQNFLHDQNIIAGIVAAIDPQPGQHIVEIGPGKGALTEHLLPLAHELEAIELDRDLIPILEEKLAPLGKLVIHQQDVLTFDFNQLEAEPQSLRIVGNLPYNISTPLLFHLMDFLPVIQDMHFMLQKEVVDRMCAMPSEKEYGRLSVMIQFYCHTEKLFTVPPGAFYPPPSVNSAIVRLIPRTQEAIADVDNASLSKIVKASFAQRRKTLRNNLKAYLSSQQIETLGIDPSCRAETLTIEDFKNLSRLYHEVSAQQT